MRKEMEKSQNGAACPQIVAVIPAYNEERFIGSVVLRTRRFVNTVIVVDDGSTDATAEVAEAGGATVLRHSVNQGKGVALNTGLRKARQLHPDVVVLLDGDGQHCPEEIPALINPILAGEADVVVGSRYLRKRTGVPPLRIWGHRVFTWLTNQLSGVRVTDSQSGFRAFSRRAIELIRFSSSGFSVESEMQFLVQEYGLKVKEIPIRAFYKDKPKRPVIVHGLMVLNGILRLVGQYRPLLFFGVPGMVLLVSGLLWGGWVVQIYRKVQTLAIGYALISVMLCILGSLSLFTGLILHSVRGLLLSLLRPDEKSRDSVE